MLYRYGNVRSSFADRREGMALVKCAECGNLLSNKSHFCPNCGYSPRGNCEECVYFTATFGEFVGKCTISEKDFVKKYKGVCPAVIKKEII